MMAEQVEPDIFKPPHYKLKQHTEAKLAALLKEYASQFTQDETSIGTTPLTEMTIDIGTSEPVSQKPHPIVMKHYQWIKNEIEKTSQSKINTRKLIKLVSIHHSCPQRRQRKILSH